MWKVNEEFIVLDSFDFLFDFFGRPLILKIAYIPDWI
jgi:hypothetical protein